MANCELCFCECDEDELTYCMICGREYCEDCEAVQHFEICEECEYKMEDEKEEELEYYEL